jgi:hypothetical protein
MQTSAGIFDNDQTAAYNQMIPSQCMIISTRRCQWAAIKMQLAVLHICKYQVKSTHGISPNSFQNDLDTLLLDSYKEVQLLEPCGPFSQHWCSQYSTPNYHQHVHHPPTWLLHQMTRRRLCRWCHPLEHKLLQHLHCCPNVSSCLQSPSVGTIGLHLWQMTQPTEMLLVCCVLAFQTDLWSNNGNHHQ